jgi:hypothetical protein
MNEWLWFAAESEIGQQFQATITPFLGKAPSTLTAEEIRLAGLEMWIPSRVPEDAGIIGWNKVYYNPSGLMR